MKPLTDMARAYRNGSTTAKSLSKQCLTIIRKKDTSLGAWVAVNDVDVHRQASLLDGEAKKCLFRSPLHGIPIGIKDIYDTVPYPTQAGSVNSYVRYPTTDAALVQILREKGALILGKTSTSEFACSFDPVSTKNPLNYHYTPGGSSCGSAAAVAAHMCFATLATQTAGSVVCPAAYCGVTGFKPSRGSFPTEGFFPVSRDLDQIGFITRSISDMVFLVDPMMSKTNTILEEDTDGTVNVGYPREWVQDIATTKTSLIFNELIELFGTKDISVTDMTMPCTIKHISQMHRTIMLYGLAQTHDSLFINPHQSLYTSGIYKLIVEGSKISFQQYQKALEEKKQIGQEICAMYGKKLSFIMLPSTPSLAPKAERGTGDPIFCVPWSLLGYPTICFPICDRSWHGLTYSLQLVGWLGEDKFLLSKAKHLNSILLDRYIISTQ